MVGPSFHLQPWGNLSMMLPHEPSPLRRWYRPRRCRRSGGCRRDPEPRGTASAPAGVSTAAAGQYPAPRWPSYFKPPTSVEDLMPAARALVRNTSGFLGVGMGVL